MVDLDRSEMERAYTADKVARLGLALFASLIFCSASAALEVPALKDAINDHAGMIPQPSAHDLKNRLHRFKTQTGYTVVVLTVPTLAGEDMKSFRSKAFQSLPLEERDRPRALLLIVALKERSVGVQTGAALRRLFPEPASSRRLLTQVGTYFDGLRRDLGIYAGVNFIMRTIRGEIRMDGVTEAEKLELASIKGAGAGAIFALFLSPYLAFVAGVLWGIYATHFGLEREIRLVMGAVLGYGTAKIVATLMAMMGDYDNSLWYFILAVSIPLGVFGSLTEFWMSGEWCGIPRVKDSKTLRKPSDKMGI